MENYSGETPSIRSYIFSVTLSSVPKIAIIVFCTIIAAFRAELFSTTLSFSVTGDRDLPLAICFYFDKDEDSTYYGDRVCNNGIAGAIMSILFAMAFMIVDLQIPCATSTFARLYHFMTFVFAAALTIYWLISAALLTDLYTRYCDDFECGDTEKKFILLPTMGFFTMSAWIYQGILSLIQAVIGKPVVHYQQDLLN